MSVPAAISLNSLSKLFGSLRAVDDLTFDVAPGEIFGFLGQNGAGKTTTIRILLDLLRPSGGSARIGGLDCQKEGRSVRGRVGYLPAEIGMPGNLTGRNVLNFLGRLSGREINGRYQSELLERLQFPESDLKKRWREYSTGMKRKIGLIQAAQTQPEILILDEPTEGMDPLAREAIHRLLADLKREGRTVFLSSHVLSEVEKICDRVGLLRKGRLVLLDSVQTIRRMARREVRIVFESAVDRAFALPPGISVLSETPREWRLEIKGPVGSLLAALKELPVEDLEIEEPSLESAIKALYIDVEKGRGS